MQIGNFARGLQGAQIEAVTNPTIIQTGPVSPRLVYIAASSYESHHQPVVVVKQGFCTPPGEVTNAQGDAVTEKFGSTPNGLFLTDKDTGYQYLYALGAGNDPREFKSIPANLLPPVLGVKEDLEEVLSNTLTLSRFEFGIKPEDIKRALPREDRYSRYSYLSAYAADGVALTMLTGPETQAVAQLLGDKELAEKFFGMSGSFYADLLTSDQWGLMALEGVLKYMTSTGELEDAQGKKIRAIDLKEIVEASKYPCLPNGILPNMVWNRVKDFATKQNQISRGGSWRNLNDENFLVCYNNWSKLGLEDINLGLRVGFFPRS